MWKWFLELRKRRRRFQAAARQLVRDDKARAYFNAQRRAAVARMQGNGPEFTHWVKTALEIARISDANMDFRELERVIAQTEREVRENRFASFDREV